MMTAEQTDQSSADAATRVSPAQVHLARELVDRYRLHMAPGWDLDDELVLKIVKLFAFDPENPYSGHRRVDSIRMGVAYDAPLDHLAWMTGLDEAEIAEMIAILRAGGRIPAGPADFRRHG